MTWKIGWGRGWDVTGRVGWGDGGCGRREGGDAWARGGQGNRGWGGVYGAIGLGSTGATSTFGDHFILRALGGVNTLGFVRNVSLLCFLSANSDLGIVRFLARTADNRTGSLARCKIRIGLAITGSDPS